MDFGSAIEIVKKKYGLVFSDIKVLKFTFLLGVIQSVLFEMNLCCNVHGRNYGIFVLDPSKLVDEQRELFTKSECDDVKVQWFIDNGNYIVEMGITSSSEEALKTVINVCQTWTNCSSH